MAERVLKEFSDETRKMLGALVPESVYKMFKSEAAIRGEKMEEAILNAAYMYLEVNSSNGKGGAKYGDSK